MLWFCLPGLSAHHVRCGYCPGCVGTASKWLSGELVLVDFIMVFEVENGVWNLKQPMKIYKKKEKFIVSCLTAFKIDYILLFYMNLKDKYNIV